MTVRVFAPAKINLTLHVTGQRDDGYHLLDSLVVFADVGDTVSVSKGADLTLAVCGPEAAGVPDGDSNSILQAARFMGQDALALSLVKNLPTAAGIGGGTADAAAALRAISKLQGIALPADVLPLGSDVPVCMQGQTTRMSGIGEVLVPAPGLPEIWAVLVNPRVAVSTPKVFAALGSKKNPPMPKTMPQFTDVVDYTKWLAGQRNDLQAPAISLEPMIGKILAVLEKSENCLLARMSGSGATCFGIFPDKESVTAAGQRIHKDHPEWWMAAGLLGSQFEQSLPH